MTDIDLEYVKNRLYPISLKISRIKRLSKIVYDLIIDPIDDINEGDIATLALILNETIASLNYKMQKLEIKLKM